MRTLNVPRPVQAKEEEIMETEKKIFLNMGIPELNALLTRDPDLIEGMAVPGRAAVDSSVMVIKGDIGTGKTVLSTILAFNLHNTDRVHRSDKLPPPKIHPYSIYFSFGQSANSIGGYIKEVAIKARGLSDEVKETWPFPFIVSSNRPALEVTGQGLALLRRLLIEHLGSLQDVPSRLGGAESPDVTGEVGTQSSNTQYIPGQVKTQSIDRQLRRFVDSDEWQVIEGGVQATLPTTSDPNALRLPVLFIDPINYFFDLEDCRPFVAELFRLSRTWNWPMILTLEDPAGESGSVHAGLARAVESEADYVLQLASQGAPFSRRCMEVIKNRHSAPIFGRHPYRIESAPQSLQNIKERHPGFFIFRNIHWYLSRSYSRVPSDFAKPRYYSGMQELDQVLSKSGVSSDDDRKKNGPLPVDSCVLVRGDKGAHKLSVAFNLLVAGIWDPREQYRGSDQHEPIPTGESVMLVSFGEEGSVEVSDVALAGCPERTELSQCCNRCGLVKLNKGVPPDKEMREKVSKEVGLKVVLNQWRPVQKLCGSCEKGLIEVSFKPGHLGVDEFLWIMEQLVQGYQPSRVLLDSTAHLRMRFPELSGQPMFFAALASHLRSKGVMLIVIDVMGKGHDPQLSYGIAAYADYIVRMEPPSDMLFIERVKAKFPKAGVKTDEMKHRTWAMMTITNVRGKNYESHTHAVTVVLDKANKNRLVAFEDDGPDAPSENATAQR